MSRQSLVARPTPAQRFHDWLSLASARLLGRVGPEVQVMKASGYGLGENGITIGETFTSPLNFRRYRCTRIEWDDEDTPVPVATVYGRELR